MTLPLVALTQKADTLIALGRELHAFGWVPATSGNFTMRLNQQAIALQFRQLQPR